MAHGETAEERDDDVGERDWWPVVRVRSLDSPTWFGCCHVVVAISRACPECRPRETWFASPWCPGVGYYHWRNVCDVAYVRIGRALAST